MLFLDPTEVSYSLKSTILKRDPKVLGNLEFTSDSDYSYSSERKKNRRKKSKKKNCTKMMKSKRTPSKKKPTKLIKENKSTTIVPVVQPVIIGLAAKNKTKEVLKTILAKRRSTNLKLKAEESSKQKLFNCNNESMSSVINTKANDNIDLYENNSNNVYAKSPKPLSPIIFETCTSSSNSLHYGLTKKLFDNTAPILLDTSGDILPLLNFKPGQKYLHDEQPTLEPIHLNPDGKNECIMEGMF